MTHNLNPGINIDLSEVESVSTPLTNTEEKEVQMLLRSRKEVDKPPPTTTCRKRNKTQDTGSIEGRMENMQKAIIDTIEASTDRIVKAVSGLEPLLVRMNRQQRTLHDLELESLRRKNDTIGNINVTGPSGVSLDVTDLSGMVPPS